MCITSNDSSLVHLPSTMETQSDNVDGRLDELIVEDKFENDTVKSPTTSEVVVEFVYTMNENGGESSGGFEVVKFDELEADGDEMIDYTSGFTIGCGICSVQLNSAESVVEHMRTHRVKTHGCRICGVVTSSANELLTHLSSHSKEVPHRCGYCRHGFFRHSSLKSHNCPKKPKVCQHCGESFRTKEALKVHIRDKHKAEVPKKRHCPHCKFSGWSGVVLNEHLRSHKNNKVLLCPHCTFEFSKVESLQRHLRIHKDEVSFSCPYCGVVFGRYGVLKLHMEIHKDRDMLQCDKCDFSSHSRVNLRSHVLRNHRPEDLVCSDCGYTTSVPYRFKTHALTHKGDSAKLHVCSACGYKSKYSWDLRRHVEAHHSAAPTYRCPHCDFTASSLSVLKPHALKHTRKLPPPDFLKIT